MIPIKKMTQIVIKITGVNEDEAKMIAKNDRDSVCLFPEVRDEMSYQKMLQDLYEKGKIENPPVHWRERKLITKLNN